MPSLSHLLAFAGLTFVVVAIPGPSVAFTISRALTIGRRGALANVAGNSVGLVVQLVAVAAGLGAVVEDSALAYTVVKLAGAAYLVGLGLVALRHRHRFADSAAGRPAASSLLGAARGGFVVGVTNPKTIAFLLVALPQFVSAGRPVATQMLVIGVCLPVIGLVLDSCWALAAGSAGEYLARSPTRLARVGGASGLAMIGLGVGLAASGRRP